MTKRVKRAPKAKRPQYGSIEYMLIQQRKRLGLKKLPREVSPTKLQAYWEARDAKLLEDKREDIKRRKKIATRLKKFEELLREELGRRVKMVMYLNDETDELSLLTYFRPKKGQHPFDGDPAVKNAFKKSKLDELMFHAGSGTHLSTGERDNHFVEDKWRPTRKSK